MVALVHSLDTYGSGGGSAFMESADKEGLAVLTTQRFVKDTADFSAQVSGLRASGAHVIVIFSQARDATCFMQQALAAGVGGEGFLWLGGDTFSGSFWDAVPELVSDGDLRNRLFKGLFAVLANGQAIGSPSYQRYLARRSRLPPAAEDGATACSQETDDDGNLIWAQDHDNDPSTPLRCSGYDRLQDGVYDTFGYDTVFAIAHALHNLLELRNRTQIVGSELLDTLLTNVSFEGLTGLVDFYDASNDTDRWYQGDRRVGFSYSLLNYADNTSWPLTVGSWTPCA
eukprot:6138940-Prymnesium_polylepis.1